MPPDDDYDLHDEQDAQRLAELARLTREGGDRRRVATLIGELISGWRPHYHHWLEVRYGLEVADNVDGRVRVKLTELLLRTQEFDMPWGAVVWVNVKRYALGDEQRDRGRHAKVASTDELAEVLPDIETAERLEAVEGPDVDADRLRRAMERVDPVDREVLGLVFYEGLGRQELAQRLGITANHAGVRKHRAIKSLIDAWNTV